MGKTIANKIKEESEFSGDEFTTICANISVHQREQLKKLKERKIISSVSGGIRLVHFFGFTRLMEEIEKGARMLSLTTKISDGFPQNNDPDVVFIYAGKGKYKKYKEVK